MSHGVVNASTKRPKLSSLLVAINVATKILFQWWWSFSVSPRGDETSNRPLIKRISMITFFVSLPDANPRITVKCIFISSVAWWLPSFIFDSMSLFFSKVISKSNQVIVCRKAILLCTPLWNPFSNLALPVVFFVSFSFLLLVSQRNPAMRENHLLRTTGKYYIHTWKIFIKHLSFLFSHF